MKKIFFMILGFLCTQSSMFLAQEIKISCCEKFIMRCDLFIATNILGMTHQDILNQAASLQDTKRFKWLLASEIGRIDGVDSEGHTPRSVAELCNSQKVLSILNSPNSVTCRKKIKFE